MAWSALGLSIVIVMVFAVIRVTTDIGNIGSGVELADSSFSKRYAENPVLAYGHILPGIVYLTVAPFQIARPVRRRHLDLHRTVGRVLIVAGLLSAVFALALGLFIPFGGIAESSATVVFGVYFAAALVLAYRAVGAGDIAAHRAWMIRAFAIGTGVGTIRVLVGFSEGFGLAEFDQVFGPAFWVAFGLHALLAEAWIRQLRAPRPPGPMVTPT